MDWTNFDKYRGALDYIIEYKPKHIVEYGSGESSFIIKELLDHLDYGGKVTSYEDNSFFLDKANELGWNNENTIKLVDIEYTDKDRGIVRYIHPTEDIHDVDFIILDGPDYKRFKDNNGNPGNITDNIEVIYNTIKYDVPFWIDGRTGCREYYKNLGYTNIIGGYE